MFCIVIGIESEFDKEDVVSCKGMICGDEEVNAFISEHIDMHIKGNSGIYIYIYIDYI